MEKALSMFGGKGKDGIPAVVVEALCKFSLLSLKLVAAGYGVTALSYLGERWKLVCGHVVRTHVLRNVLRRKRLLSGVKESSVWF